MKRLKKDVWICTEKKKERLKGVYIGVKRKKEVNEQFRRKMNEDMNGNKKLFWKELSKMKGGELQQNKGWKWEASTDKR